MSAEFESLESALDTLAPALQSEVKRILYGNPAEPLAVSAPTQAQAAARNFEVKAYKIAAAAEQVHSGPAAAPIAVLVTPVVGRRLGSCVRHASCESG